MKTILLAALMTVSAQASFANGIKCECRDFQRNDGSKIVVLWVLWTDAAGKGRVRPMSPFADTASCLKKAEQFVNEGRCELRAE